LNIRVFFINTRIYKKLIKYSSIFYKLRNKLPSSCLRSIYYAFVHPHILYGIELYANTFSTYLKPLNVLNNKLLIILQNCRLQTPVAHLYREYQTLPINQLFIVQILTLVHTFFQYVGSVLWNEIPQLLKNSMSKYTFKRKLKAHLLNEQAIF